VVGGCLRLVPLCVLLPLIGGVVKTASMLSAVAELELDVIGKHVLLLLLPSPSSTDNVTSMCVVVVIFVVWMCCGAVSSCRQGLCWKKWKRGKSC
jgi:hypothetical protein